MNVVIFSNMRVIFHRLPLVVIVITALVTGVAMGCSVWNEGKSCNCECEDISVGCRATCHNMCIGGCHGTLEIISQKHCYDKCHAEFQDCIHSCYWKPFCAVALSNTKKKKRRKRLPIWIVLFTNWTKIVVLMCERAVFYQKKLR